jgi:hypothetical protein
MPDRVPHAADVTIPSPDFIVTAWQAPDWNEMFSFCMVNLFQNA